MELAKQAFFNKINNLYHYQPFKAEWLKETLVENKIYCSHPADFNDPWDMKPLIKDLDNEIISREYLEYLTKAMIENNISKDSMDRALNDASFLKYMSASSAIAHWNFFEENFRVYCLSPKNDNLLMWSHYADKHHGICLEFETNNIVFGSAWMVEYHDEYPYHSWRSDYDPIRLALTKATCWKYEEEYRILPKTNKANEKQQQSILVDECNKLVFPRQALKSIIIGCKANYDEIKDFIYELRPDLSVRKALMQHNHYGLDIY
ncbi:DUF2971 domain-containing protein [Enterobacter asburiae]|uniref:DUF2971 domain-containing protein n=1 Tax=Enterobacter asburiae TaxID=61645 RepID=UPI0011D1B630|nr:DUF2971 domain-containing protein [Enterobacter asburiae]